MDSTFCVSYDIYNSSRSRILLPFSNPDSSSKIFLARSVSTRKGLAVTMTTPDKLKTPKVIGIYGVPGSGKTTLLHELKAVLDVGRFSFYEGSEMIARTIDGGLTAFHNLDEQSKEKSRRLAIQTIHDDCARNRKTAIVTGHFMFWREEDTSGEIACTDSDLAIYTHIIYLNVSPETIDDHCSKDAKKRRDPCSVTHLLQWQQAERTTLSTLCREHAILFSVVDSHQIAQGKIYTLIRDFDLHDESVNSGLAERTLDQIVSSYLIQVDTVMVIDGDRTIAPQDTGTLFYEMAMAQQQSESYECPLKTLFSSPLGYTYTAFRQATLLCEATSSDEAYEKVCEQVASATTLHPEFVALLRLAAQLTHVGTIIVSCGLLRVWEIVIERLGLRDTVAIIAGGRIADGMVVTAAVKTELVTRLQTYHNKKVWAFGDSVLDLEMLKAADQAVVVVIEEEMRSGSMEDALLQAIENEALHARQVLIPETCSPRLDTTRLPLLDITKIDFVNTLLHRGDKATKLSVTIAADSASKLLATPMRDAAIQGPVLRKAHERAGEYLALQHVSDILGLEQRPISHVLGYSATGFQLERECQTTIVSLMRGGDPMASGVSKAFPRAMYVHVRVPQDLKVDHLKGQQQIVLVDSVVNTGKSVIECVQAIRGLCPDIQIVIVTGVVQAQCLYRNSVMYKVLAAAGRVHLVALRVSDTKFTGSGTTDTGNRLFNTTHLP
jgi:uracil phosphoribosyltransferase/phosphoserine phosphatase/adenylate kinase